MKHLIVLLILTTMYSCTSNECCEFPEDLGEESPLVDFGNLEEGDLLKYQFFYGNNYYSDENTRCYTEDTLIIEVVEVISDEEIIIEEYMSAGSEILQVFPDSNYMWNTPNTVSTYNWSIQNDELIISDVDDQGTTWLSSKLTYFNSTFPLKNDSTINVVFDKWKPQPLWGNSCSEVEILEKTYTDLLLHVENGPTAADGNGGSFLYNNEYAFVRTFTQSAWTGAIQGWDLAQ